jgi:hypothetical protein
MASKRKADQLTPTVDAAQSAKSAESEDKSKADSKRLKRIEQLKKVALAMQSGICECYDDFNCNGWQCHCECVPCVCAPLTCLGKELRESECEVVIVLKKNGEEYQIKL